MELADRDAGRLIGTGGTRIMLVRELSRASVFIGPPQMPSRCRTLRVEGVARRVGHARRLINLALAFDPFDV